ncbi:MAG: hypothetical protein INR70_23465 [Parafilimonas terrae]|nr:hypothetical protein [Parafilimonas terrae]
MSDSPEAVTPRATRLRRVAGALGVPVESFMDETASSSWSEISALLKAFTAITDTQGRRRVLALAQVDTRSQGKAEAAQAVRDGPMS